MATSYVRYEMMIDGSTYVGYFEDHFIAGDFIDEVESDGSIVIVKGYSNIADIDFILNDSAIEYAYRIELIALATLENATRIRKWNDMELVLKALGII